MTGGSRGNFPNLLLSIQLILGERFYCSTFINLIPAHIYAIGCEYIFLVQMFWFILFYRRWYKKLFFNVLNQRPCLGLFLISLLF